ncbi:hypothetical protein ROZALSC1DRAFT_27670 [Rozella allomycis CSF55]|uniref:Sodium/calcium exchanger membrane region domain-containing protein n=1 Tax=Rozella allomycis (strain CSF55) TaxID=988480 RepID=A0A4P9YNP3_ROZAC|nr:hypothetical protein ROZALSC1DRAFT_27670 [Rozella allomycis CSF55]
MKFWNAINKSLEIISQYLKLSPDVAGVTLLAIGNGAPDFFTALTGTQEKAGMVFGSSVGSGLFITTFVLGIKSDFCDVDIEKPSSDTTVSSGAIEMQTTLSRKESIQFFVSERQNSLSKVSFVKNIILFLLSVVGVVAIAQTSLIANEDKIVKDVSNETTFNFRHLPKYLIDYSGFHNLNLIDRIIFILKSPIELISILSVPPLLDDMDIDQNNAWKFESLVLYRIRLVINPFCSFFLILFLSGKLNENINGFPLSYIVMTLSFIFSLIFAKTSSWKSPPVYNLLIVIYAFVVTIFWIYAVTQDVVELLQTIGMVLKIKDAVLGIIILAWGNSFGDLIANIAIARSGSFETAVTAIFCGPIQNVLLTLGVSLLNLNLSDGPILPAFTGMIDIYLAFAVLVLAALITLIFWSCPDRNLRFIPAVFIPVRARNITPPTIINIT